MKITKTLLVATALAGSFCAFNATADFAAGDLMVGFRSTTATGTNLVFSIGSASSYISATTTTTISGVTAGQLTSAFGSLNNLYFSVFGYVDAANAGTLGFSAQTLFLTKSRPGSYTPGTNPNGGTASSLSLSSGAQGTVVGQLIAIGQGALDSTSLGAGIAGESASRNVGGSISYFNGIKNPSNAGIGGNVNNTWSRYPVEGGNLPNFTSGTDPIALDLYQQNPGSANSGVFLGTFTLDTAGTLMFTPTAVPEPSTLALFGGGLLALAAVRRFGRKN